MAFPLPAEGSASQNVANSEDILLTSQSSPIAPVITSWHRTQVNVNKFCVTCTIPNFSSYRKGNDGRFYITSPCFKSPAGFIEDAAWHFFLLEKDAENVDEVYLSIFLGVFCFEADTETFKHCKVDISLTNGNHQKALPDEVCRDLGFTFGSEIGYKFVLVGNPKFVPLNVLLNPSNGYLPDNKLTISCDVTAATERLDTWKPSCELQVKLPEYKLPDDFGSLFENQEFSDLTISVGGKQLLVHKAILAARSPVFAAMFNHKMKESEQILVTIADIEYEVLEEMIVYIYTGRSPNVEKMAEDLLIASDKYNVSGLKVLCEMVLFSRLTVENATNLLILADMYSAKQLKPLIISFIGKQAKDVIKRPAWKDMSRTHHHLVSEAFEAVVFQ